ncbi:MAG: phosphoribosyltransferase [Rhodomicrobium sp.]
MIYKNRVEAGKELAQALALYENQESVILALPRGGAVVAAQISRAFDAPLDLVLVRKLGAPMQPELAMGAVVDDAEISVVRNEDIISSYGITEEEFDYVLNAELDEIERRRRLYLGDRPRARVRGRVAIVVDDGIATGATVRAACKAIRKRNPAELVIAAPVAPTSISEELGGDADEIVCPHCFEPFYAIGFYYEDFRQISDEEVIRILDCTRAPGAASRRERYSASGKL